jgi:glucokinase
MTLTLGVDIGGTKVLGGIVTTDGDVLAQARRPTPASDPAGTLRMIGEVIGELLATRPVDAIGIGAAGWIDAARSTILFAPNLAWRDEPLRDHIAAQFGLPVVVENDANAAAWAEARFGAGRGQQYLVVLTVGTGLGGGLVIGGELYRGRLGIAAEFGHVTVEPGGRRCGCGARGCWERYASGRALILEAQELATVSPAIAGRLLELAGGQPEAITGLDVTRAAQDGDEAALEAFRVIGTWLGQGMAALSAILDPGMFVLGGGVSAAGELLREPAERSLHERITARAYREVPGVRLAELGPGAGIVGAADLARRR